MDPVLDEFERAAQRLEYRPPRIPIVSNLWGRVVEDEVLDARYWRRHLRNTVRFADGVQELARRAREAPAPVEALLRAGRLAALGLLLVACLALVAADVYNPFLCFRF